MTSEQVAIIALTGLVLIVGVAALVADRGRRQWAARCAERTAEACQWNEERNAALIAESEAFHDRDVALELIADMVPQLKHAGMSPLLKRRAADLLDGS